MNQSRAHFRARAAFVALAILGVAAQGAAGVPPDWVHRVGNALLIMNPEDQMWPNAHLIAEHASSDTAVVIFHGVPGKPNPQVYPAGTRDMLAAVDSNFGRQMRTARNRVLVVCYGNVPDSEGRVLAEEFAKEFGSLYAPNGWINPGIASQNAHAVRADFLPNGGTPVDPARSWAEVHGDGREARPVSSDELYERLYGRNATNRLDDAPGAGSYGGAVDPLEPGVRASDDLSRFARPSGSRVGATLSNLGSRLSGSPTARFASLLGAGLAIDWAIYRGVYALTGNDAWATFATIPGGLAGTAAVEHVVFGTAWSEAFGYGAGSSFRLGGAATTSFAGVATVAALGIQLNLMALEVRQGIYARINDPDFDGFTPQEADAWGVNGFTGYGRALRRTYWGE